MNLSRKNTGMTNWMKLFVYSALAGYLYAFMEWLFFVTMPSFMSGMTFIEKIEIPFVTGSGLALFLLAPVLIVFILSLPFRRLRFSKLFFLAAALFPAFLLTVLLLILVDNFTYTVFKFGIVSTAGWGRGIYSLGLVVLFVYITWRLTVVAGRPARKRSGLAFPEILAAALLSVSLIVAIGQFKVQPNQEPSVVGAPNKLPNIILIGGDGLNAENMSMYGYERDTTPFLRQIASSSLVAENAFSNASITPISIISILTGKNPTQTHVLVSNNILTGADSYEHLPGILRRQGYYTVQIGVPHYVDAYDMNLQDGFDIVNQRSLDENPTFQLGRRFGFYESTYFLSRIADRVSSRLLHIFFLRTMENPYETVTQPDEQISLGDSDKIGQLLNLFSANDKPLFVHIHLMDTHGPQFSPRQSTYSGNETQSRSWMVDFYDDSILDFDSYIKQVFDALSASGDLDNTVIIIYTDHNMLWQSNQRIPLMFHFPNGEHSGVIKNNAQNLDIAPTLLDYLGIIQPEWMTGQSLLQGELPNNRLISSGNDIDFIKVVDCQRWYWFSLEGVWFTGEVRGHTAPCAQIPVANADEIPARILEHLALHGFPVQYLPEDESLFSTFYSRWQIAVALLRAKFGAAYAPDPAAGIFSDVPASDPEAAWVEQAYHQGIMDGCKVSPLSFCPNEVATRDSLALFLLKALEGADYVPPAAQGIFEDVPATSQFAPWIEELYRRGITAGCSRSPMYYCPKNLVLGDQLSILLARAFPQP